MNITSQMSFSTGAVNLLDHRAERLLVTGYRCIAAGYEFCDIDCWEAAWSIYSNELDVLNARRTLGEVQYMVRTMRAMQAPALSLFPQSCSRISHDESKILNLVACAQQQDRAATAAAAFMITPIGTGNLSPLVDASSAVASAFDGAGLRFLAIGQDVLDRLTGKSNDSCDGCPAGGGLLI